MEFAAARKCTASRASTCAGLIGGREVWRVREENPVMGYREKRKMTSELLHEEDAKGMGRRSGVVYGGC